MLGERRAALDLAQLVGPERQLPAGGDAGVLLAERAGRRVAGVDERAAARLGLPPVELLERRDRHVHLAPHLDAPRDVGSLALQLLGDGGDGAARWR